MFGLNLNGLTERLLGTLLFTLPGKRDGQAYLRICIGRLQLDSLSKSMFSLDQQPL
ncbi:MAG: hypothetical protein K2X38_03195 [Gemmataceae bacterium]|nr:hypothetical protein [Gemmataceae bacterium]